MALGETVEYPVPLDDFADLYMKGLLAGKGSVNPVQATVTPSGTSGDIELTFDNDSILALARGLARSRAKTAF